MCSTGKSYYYLMIDNSYFVHKIQVRIIFEPKLSEKVFPDDPNVLPR